MGWYRFIGVRLANLTSGEATVGGAGELRLVSSMVCSFANMPPSADAADAAPTTLGVAFGAVAQPLGRSIELVNGMSTWDAKSSSESQKGVTGSVGK